MRCSLASNHDGIGRLGGGSGAGGRGGVVAGDAGGDVDVVWTGLPMASIARTDATPATTIPTAASARKKTLTRPTPASSRRTTR